MLLTFSEDGTRRFPYPVEIFEDTIAEGTERLTVRLSAPPGETGVTFHRDSTEISIIDDDSITIIDAFKRMTRDGLVHN